MRPFAFVLSLIVFSLAAAAPLSAARTVPFKGTWSGVTVSANPVSFPVVSIVA